MGLWWPVVRNMGPGAEGPTAARGEPESWQGKGARFCPPGWSLWSDQVRHSQGSSLSSRVTAFVPVKEVCAALWAQAGGGWHPWAEALFCGGEPRPGFQVPRA